MAKRPQQKPEPIPKIGKKEYARDLRRLQIELVKLHRQSSLTV